MTNRPRVLDLFRRAAGGWSLGLHWAGYRTIAACEADPWRREMFGLNNPRVKMYGDIRTLTASAAGLLPTPKKSDRDAGAILRRPGDKRGGNLKAALELLPTPTVTGLWNRKGCSPNAGDGLVTALKRLLPTPTRSDGHRGAWAACETAGNARPPREVPAASWVITGSRALLPIVEAMMGYPPGWLASASLPMEMPLFHGSPR